MTVRPIAIRSFHKGQQYIDPEDLNPSLTAAVNGTWTTNRTVITNEKGDVLRDETNTHVNVVWNISSGGVGSSGASGVGSIGIASGNKGDDAGGTPGNRSGSPSKSSTSRPTQQGNQPKTPSNPLLCDKAGIGCGNDPPQDRGCFGSFAFAGLEGDLGAVDIFAGQLLESTVEGLEVGPLYEASVGDGGTLGGAINQNLRTGQTSGFAFGGGKLSVGPLAGVQVGFIITPNGSVGLYYESHRGPVAAGGGFAISKCSTQQPH